MFKGPILTIFLIFFKKKKKKAFVKIQFATSQSSQSTSENVYKTQENLACVD